MKRECEICYHWVYERGTLVPYGDTYVMTPGGYRCDIDEECEEGED